MKFFVDNNLSDYLAKGMKAFGEDVVHLKEYFPEETKDVDWLKFIGENDLILITRDERIRRNPAELSAFRKHNVGAFFLGGKKLDKCKIIQQVVHNWPKIKQYAIEERRPFAFRIPPTGKNFSNIPLS